MTILAVVGALFAFIGAALFVLAMLEAADLRARGEPNRIRPGELHHAYLACLLLIATAPLGGWKALLGVWVAAVLICDDAYEHLWQLAEPAFQSPLHRLYGATLYRLAPIRWLQGQLDRLFGKAAA